MISERSFGGTLVVKEDISSQLRELTYFLHTKPLEEKITEKKTKDEKINLIGEGAEIACTAD